MIFVSGVILLKPYGGMSTSLMISTELRTRIVETEYQCCKKAGKYNDIGLSSNIIIIQTGKYVLLAEDLPRANNCHAHNDQSNAQNLNGILVKCADSCKKYHYKYGSAAMGVFSKRANLTGKNIFLV